MIVANVKPFRAIRPVADKVHLVASRSYISYNKKALRAKLNENPFTFLHILNPEYKDQKRTPPNSMARFQKIKNKFNDFVRKGILNEDPKANFYVYRQLKEGHTYLGIIACASVEDYETQLIKKHEATLSHREEIFKTYLQAVEINAEPVCFTYPNQAVIDEITIESCKQRPTYDFTTTNQVRHTFWIIQSEDKIQKLIEAFAKVPTIYIADGHHRSASSALLGRELRAKNPNHNGQEGYNFFMGYFIPESNLQIFAFNRLIKNLGPLNKEELIEKIKAYFTIEHKKEGLYVPRKKYEIGMYHDRKWYKLIPKAETYQGKDVVSSLDVSILSDYILNPIFGIKDLRTDERIYFKGEPDGLTSLQKEVDEGKAKVAFTHFPVSLSDLKAIADEGKTMPPKSTWVEPKLRSGLTVYSINQKI